MSRTLELEESFKSSCADFNQNAQELSKQMEQTREELQKYKDKNDGRITELEGIQERLKDIQRRFREIAAGHNSSFGLASSDIGNRLGDRNREGKDKDEKAKEASDL